MVQSFFVCVEEVPDCFISFEMTRYAETFSKILRLKAQNDSNSLSTKVDPTSKLLHFVRIDCVSEKFSKILRAMPSE